MNISNCPNYNDHNDGMEHNTTIRKDCATGKYYVWCVTCGYQSRQHNTVELAIKLNNDLCARIDSIDALTAEVERLKKWCKMPLVLHNTKWGYWCENNCLHSNGCTYKTFDESIFEYRPHPDCINATGDKGDV